MSAASSCAQSCARSAARPANARRGAGYPATLALLYPAASTQSGVLKSAKGVPPTYSYPGPQYDADGVSVGAVPAYHAGKGVWCGPGYTQMLQNSKFVGAVSGTPGTAPTGWSFPFSGATIVVGANGDLTFTSDGATRAVFQQNINVNALTSYKFSFVAIFDGVLPLLATYSSASRFPSGTTLAVYVDGILANTTDVPIAGTHIVDAIYAVGATGGTAYVKTGIGCEGARIGTVTISNPMLTTLRNAPYVATGPGETITVPSAAGTSGGNGLAWEMDAKVLAALGGKDGQPAKCTVAAVVTAGASSADATIDTNILTGRDAVASLLYFASGGVIKSNDGTTPATVTVSGGWSAGQKLLIVIEYGPTTYRVGYLKVGAETVPTYGDAVTRDGSFNPGTHIRAALTTPLPMHLAGLQVWDEPEVDEATIEKYFKKVGAL